MPTKIEDGFETSSGGTSSMQPAAPRSTMTPTMILAIVAIVLFAGGLGFIGGMQVNKSSQNSTMNGAPGGNSPMPQQQTNSSAGGASSQQGPPSSTNSNQQAAPQSGGTAPGSAASPSASTSN